MPEHHPETGSTRALPDAGGPISVIPVCGLPPLRSGDDLATLIRAAVALRDGDVVVVAQKAVSKCEGREVSLLGVEPSAEALSYAQPEEDPRVIELILRESVRVVRRRGSFLVCETRHGFVCASAGVDRSNTSGDDLAILLPVDPDASARALRAAFALELAVIVSDSFGRPFRTGTTGVAVGCAGLEPVTSFTGLADDRGRVLQGTEVHVADQLASAAELAMGPIGGVPAAVIRGFDWASGTAGARDTVIPADRDLFR